MTSLPTLNPSELAGALVGVGGSGREKLGHIAGHYGEVEEVLLVEKLEKQQKTMHEEFCF